ncbi:hypothetical protein PTSG_01502 [Salpingoeca rosetta]|uniref:Uncharacterized protein n=1 Tax=Salpingoeca rosetta (strain ATCC 50818 / BSB-021) TaxID=946362 RepID=F2U0J0_SALR5|nr:uncharacterized protein PTSG_01502 [Salpingoeca rosetta]EGD80918.1 hypothetical protein PTSG_01502 [Salpingoeca rosetta]|eukprot:XP_004997479.1 hypothetical protein PTSG_01502 [Salpingoeca rosetta]
MSDPGATINTADHDKSSGAVGAEGKRDSGHVSTQIINQVLAEEEKTMDVDADADMDLGEQGSEVVEGDTDADDTTEQSLEELLAYAEAEGMGPTEINKDATQGQRQSKENLRTGADADAQTADSVDKADDGEHGDENAVNGAEGEGKKKKQEGEQERKGGTENADEQEDNGNSDDEDDEDEDEDDDDDDGDDDDDDGDDDDDDDEDGVLGFVVDTERLEPVNVAAAKIKTKHEVLPTELPLEKEEKEIPSLDEKVSLTKMGAVSATVNLMGMFLFSM